MNTIVELVGEKGGSNTETEGEERCITIFVGIGSTDQVRESNINPIKKEICYCYPLYPFKFSIHIT